MMTKRCRMGVGVAAALMLTACGGPVGDDAARGTGKVTIALAGVPRVARTAQAVGTGLPPDVERIGITCTGADMDPVTGNLPLDGSPLVLRIPAGLDRRFAADAWAGTTHRMAGSSLLASLAVNETATMSITLEELGTITFATSPPAALQVVESVTLAPDLAGFENPSVLWSVDGHLGGNLVVGTITADGVYTAPATVPTPATVTIRVASALAPDLYAEAKLTIEAAPACDAELVVDSTADTLDIAPGDGECLDASGACTLRAAVQEANACPGATTLLLPAGTYTLALAGAGEDAAATGDLDVTDDLTISGAGADVTVIDGNALDRVFHSQGVVLTVGGVTVRNGLAQGVTCMEACGGGILATGGALTLVAAAVEDNRAVGTDVGNAGGIYAAGATLTLTNVTVANNTASGPSWSVGGGILKTGGGDATITNTTISGNTCDFYGGGMQINGGITTLVNTTVTGNRAGRGGAGLYVKDVGNDAAFHLSNTIVAGQAGSGDCGSDGPDPVVADGFNIDGDGSCDGATTAGSVLETLADNGGPTRTHALVSASSAIDAGDDAVCPATDQRGEPRDDGACDVGAYEYQGSGISVSVGPASLAAAAGGSRIFTATVTGTTDQTVVWAVEASTCSAPGTIDADGTYTAGVPAADCTETVRATSRTDPTKSATATVSVPAVGVSISPAAALVAPAASQGFVATVSGAADTTVTWTLDASTCGAAQGTIAADGTYSAGSPSGTCEETVRAASNADPTKSATATVTVAAPVVVGVTPATASAGPGESVSFGVTVTGAGDPSVTWTVESSTCSDPGTVAANGTYTAGSPAAPCQDLVRATSVQDPTASATATVSMTVPITVTVSGPTSVDAGTSAGFTATVVGATDTAVTWYVNDVAGGNAVVGTVSVDGTYTAPGTVPTPDAVTIKAVSAADGTTSGTASVRVTVLTCLGGYLAVDSTLDAADAAPGNGSCDDGAGNCTLRAAIEEANACPGLDAIDVPVGTYLLSLGALTVSDELTLTGAGAASTIVDGNAASGVFSIAAGLASVGLADLTVRNGSNGYGAGILLQGGTPTTIRGAVIRDNTAANAGGAFFLQTDADLTVVDSTITGNRSGNAPGGSAFLVKDGVDLTIRSSTISYNELSSSTGSGAGVILDWSYGSPLSVTIENSTIVGNDGTAVRANSALTVHITNSTVTNNTVGLYAGAAHAASQINVTNSILSRNGTNCQVDGGAIVSGGHNIDSRNTCGFAAAGDQVNTDPVLGALVDNGGPTRTRGLLTGSPALDAGDITTCPATDQRGVARSDGACDIGAVEGAVADVTCVMANWGADPTVDSTTDAVDANVGDGICDDGTGSCTLRAAIQETNACVGADVIDVQPGTYALTITGANEDVAATGDLDITDELTVNGSGAATTIIDGGAPFDDRIFHVLNHVATAFDGLTLQGIDIAWGANGGAIATGGDLTVTNAVITGNTAGHGVAIYGWDAVSTLDLVDTTLSDNATAGDNRGGAVYVAGTLNAFGCTFSGNTAGSYGGAIYGGPGSTVNITGGSLIDANGGTWAAVVGMDDATIRITDSTVSNSVPTANATRGVTGWSNSTITITRSTISGNTGGGVSSTGAYGYGGGSALTVIDSTISENRATAVGSFSVAGAGIYSDGTLSITGSTVSGNRIINGGLGGGGTGAGILIDGSGSITNSTISGNSNGGQNGRGGGIGGAGTLTMVNSTVYGNRAPNGGGIALWGGTLTISNSIVSNNSTDCEPGGGNMTATSNGHNIESQNYCGFTDPTDQVNTDPMLTLLADYGGSTWTHGLNPASPAIDAGVCAAAPVNGVDQRGVIRPEDGDLDGTATCDIGAFEYVP